MKLRCTFLSVLAFLFIYNLCAQETLVFEEWVSKSGTQDFYIHGKSVTDGVGSVYQVGATINDGGNYDGIITKYDRGGDEIWTETFNPSITGDETFIDVVLTSSGDVVATGASRNSSETQSDVFTVSLDGSDGSENWTDTYAYSSSLFNLGTALTLDGSDNVYITGMSTNTSTLGDVLALKYNSSGTLQWASTRDNIGLNDGAVKLVLSGSKLTATGATQISGNKYRYYLVEFDAGNGNFNTESEGVNDVQSTDRIQDVVLDDQDNIYVTGFAGTQTEVYNIHTIKLDDELNVIWEDSYNYSGSYDDRAYGIVLDNSNNVIVTGCSDLGSGNTQFTTIKYAGSNGNIIWSDGYDISTAADTAKAATVDSNNDIIISGSFSNGSNRDIKTIKYRSTGGVIWEMDYNGVHNGDEYVLDITLDGDDVLVTGQTWTGSGYQYATVKYSELEYTDLSFSSNEQTNGIAFIKNNGQLRDTSGTGHGSVKYMSKYGPTMSFYKDDAFEWITRTYHNDTTMNDTVQKVSFAFASPNTGVRVRPYNKSTYFENHYIPHGMKSYERLPVYGKLLYHDIWKDVDMETCITSDKELRFTVKPNGKANDIELDITGADSIKKNIDGTVSVYFFNGAVQIPRPRAYQETTPGNLQELAWQPALKLTGNTLSLDSIGSYNSTKDLVIRISRGGGDIPQADGLCHSTYFGSDAEEYSFDSCTDTDGSFISTGYLGNFDFYVGNNGLVEISESGLLNASQGYVFKADRDFVPDFLTVIYGADPLIFQGVDVKSNGNIFAAGHTSAGNMPLENNVGAQYNQSFLGFRDGYIVQLDGNSGILLWTTYFGGDNNGASGPSDEIFDIAIDSEDNVFIAGRVLPGSTNFPFTDLPGAYNEDQLNNLSGYLAKFDNSLDLVWCTQIGGNSDDFALGLDVSNNDHVAVMGLTRSTDIDFDLVSGTTQDLTLAGINDWFVVEFDENGAYKWGTLEGSDGEEFWHETMHAVAFASDNGIYFGYNTSHYLDTDLEDPAGISFFNNEDSGDGSFSKYPVLVKYNPIDYSVDWHTQLNDGVSLNRLNALTIRDNLIAVGGISSDDNLAVTDQGSILYTGTLTEGEFSTSPGIDGFIMIFDHNDYAKLYATYFGGTDNGDSFYSDVVRAITINPFDEVFISGITRSVYNSDEDLVGIPVFNNGVNNNYYQEIIGGGFSDNPNEDIYFSKLCLEGTPLDVTENDLLPIENLIVYPNPVQNRNLSFQLPSKCKAELVQVFDSKGALVQSLNGVTVNKNEIILNKEFTPGLYILRVSACQKDFSSKFIVTH